MSVRKLPPILQQKAISELNENPQRILEDIESLRSWLKHQPHLKIRDENQFLLGVLRGCKFSIEKSKQKLEMHHTYKTFAAEFFKNKDPFEKSFQSLLNTETLYIKSYLASPTIYYVRWKNLDEFGMSLAEIGKSFFMNLDVLINEKDEFVINGLIIILDFKDMPLKTFLKWDINVLKKLFSIINSCYVRIKQIYVINTLPIVHNIYSAVKIVFSKKFERKVSLHNEALTSKLYESVLNDLLPKEFGGLRDDGEQVRAEWKHKFESYKQWFEEDDKYRSYEELRVGPRPTYSHLFEVEGSFRTLDCD
ncbi:hypothetical protein FQR65_LT06015 [Abscondita terminalis]|nr:hypothetical protein FQR65_LT06015 [Abscondita terminalis]